MEQWYTEFEENDVESASIVTKTLKIKNMQNNYDYIHRTALKMVKLSRTYQEILAKYKRF